MVFASEKRATLAVENCRVLVSLPTNPVTVKLLSIFFIVLNFLK